MQYLHEPNIRELLEGKSPSEFATLVYSSSSDGVHAHPITHEHDHILGTARVPLLLERLLNFSAGIGVPEVFIWEINEVVLSLLVTKLPMSSQKKLQVQILFLQNVHGFGDFKIAIFALDLEETTQHGAPLAQYMVPIIILMSIDLTFIHIYLGTFHKNGSIQKSSPPTSIIK